MSCKINNHWLKFIMLSFSILNTLIKNCMVFSPFQWYRIYAGYPPFQMSSTAYLGCLNHISWRSLQQPNKLPSRPGSIPPSKSLRFPFPFTALLKPKSKRVPSNSSSLPSYMCLTLIPSLLSTFYHTYTRARRLGLLDLLQGLIQDILFSVLILLYMLRQTGGGIPGLDKHSVRKSTGLDLTEAVDALTQWASVTSEVQVGRLFGL